MEIYLPKLQELNYVQSVEAISEIMNDLIYFGHKIELEIPPYAVIPGRATLVLPPEDVVKRRFRINTNGGLSGYLHRRFNDGWKNLLSAIEKYKQDIGKERKRQAQIKEKYGLKSLDYLISELDTDLAELYERQARGEKVELPIRNKEELKKRYEEARRELTREIALEQSLSISMPELLTVIRVIPEATVMVEDKEIEQIGMEIAMEYEKSEGRVSMVIEF